MQHVNRKKIQNKDFTQLSSSAAMYNPFRSKYSFHLECNYPSEMTGILPFACNSGKIVTQVNRRWSENFHRLENFDLNIPRLNKIQEQNLASEICLTRTLEEIVYIYVLCAGMSHCV